jgi:hypothetical protein
MISRSANRQKNRNSTDRNTQKMTYASRSCDGLVHLTGIILRLKVQRTDQRQGTPPRHLTRQPSISTQAQARSSVAAYHTPGRNDTRFLNGRTVLAAFHRALGGSAPGEWLPEFPPVSSGGSGLIQGVPGTLLERSPFIITIRHVLQVITY